MPTHCRLSLHAFFSLKSLLSEAEEADTFVQLAEKSQRAILTDILGDGMSDLVNSIIWSIKQVSEIPSGQALCVEYSSIFMIISLTEIIWLISLGQNIEL